MVGESEHPLFHIAHEFLSRSIPVVAQVLQTATARMDKFIDKTLALSNAPALLGFVSQGKSLASTTVSGIRQASIQGGADNCIQQLNCFRCTKIRLEGKSKRGRGWRQKG